MLRLLREASYRHGMRVRLGPSLARGVLLHCERRDGSGFYWAVRLQPSGPWVYDLSTLVVEGPGAEVAEHCASCDLPYLREAGSGVEICARCSLDQFGPPTREPADAAPTPHGWNVKRGPRHF